MRLLLLVILASSLHTCTPLCPEAEEGYSCINFSIPIPPDWEFI